jgi:alginate O-acetyltransferase complex protein AlgI
MWLGLSLSLNLGLLGYFKYSNFFIENVNDLLSAMGVGAVGWTAVALPLGISFFTFESITYVVDVYRGVHAPLKRFWDYQMYILLFPKLIAGPIVRYHEIADQIHSRQESSQLFLSGFYRFVIGIAKKVLIANRLGALSAPYFLSDASQLSAAQAWIGLFAALMQIYFDFSGYSDMALGLGRMLGFKFPENFNNPFISRSLTEFWQRWHITLSAWLQSYLFTPLWINLRHWRRAGLPIALITTFLVSGLWHGAAWNFLIWGGFHGLILLLERLFLHNFLRRIGRLPRIMYTLLLVVLANGIFKIEDLGHAQHYYRSLFALRQGVPYKVPTELWVVLGTALLLSIVPAIPKVKRVQDWLYADEHTTSGHVLLTVLTLIVLTFVVSFLAWSSYNPFLYFRF